MIKVANDGLKTFLDHNKIEYSCNVDLKRKSWIKTGGVASIWILPKSIDQLTILGRYLYQNGFEFDVIGYTSNIFFRESYNPNIVVSTLQLRSYVIDGDKAICECGTSISALSKSFVKSGYLGFYGLVDLPGTIAAAICNNAGCFNCRVSSHLDAITFLNSEGNIETLRYEDLEFKHRSTILKERRVRGIILQVTLNIKVSDNPAEEVKKAEEVHNSRLRLQEVPAKNLGSIYSRLRLRSNIRNFTFRLINKLYKLDSKRYKHLMLSLYGYSYLDKYISDKNINTFIWADERAEQMFDDYCNFMVKIYKDVVMEIETKG